MKQLCYRRINRQGRLANQLFFLCSSYGLAKKSGRQLILPKWMYEQYFIYSDKIGNKEYYEAIDVQEEGFHYCGAQFDKELSSDRELISITGYLQSEKYFKDYEGEIREMLTFRPEFKYKVSKGMDMVFSKPVIAIHIRRGDYIGNENYYQLPLLYYILALEEHFTDWMTNYNILIFSDDIMWCKTYLAGDNIYYSEGRTDIEDMCLMSMCFGFILSNSSYSWWSAYLSNTTGKIIRPSHMFAGDLHKSHIMKDFWPEKQISFDHEDKKLDFSDVDFHIPVHHDHEDRRINLLRILYYLNDNFNSNIIVGEQGSEEFRNLPFEYKYMYFDKMGEFHRTKMLNDMSKECDSTIIVNYDADVIIPVIQLLQAVKLLRRGIKCVFPYDGRFARIHKNMQSEDISNMNPDNMLGSRKCDPVSVGGCIMFRKEAFVELGMENEYFISYGPEDTERVVRIEKLGVKIKRIKGVLYHYDHYVGPNSSGRNPHFGANNSELDKIQKMDKKELKNYIKSWKWLNFE